MSESPSLASLTVGDPVSITKNEETLEGVISYMGPVEFNSSSDWIGIRLTGSSINKGKNDGTVQSIKYFDAPPNCGMFIKSNSVSKRVLTRLEGIKLKRELKGAPLNLPDDTSSRRLTRASSSMEDDDGSVTSMRSTGTSASNRNRIEELRKKRMELKVKNKIASPSVVGSNAANAMASAASVSSTTNTTSSTPSKPAVATPSRTPAKRPSTPRSTSIKKKEETPTRTTPLVRKPKTPSSSSIKSTSSDSIKTTSTQVTHLKEKINILEAQLSQQAKEIQENSHKHLEEKSSLQKDLNNLQEKYKNLSQKYMVLKEKDTNSTIETEPSTEELSTLQSQLSELNATNKILTQEKEHLQHECNSLTAKYTTLKSNHEVDLNKANATITLLEEENVQYKADTSIYNNEIMELKEKLSLRPLESSNNFREQAKVQAEILKYQRQIQEYESEQQKQEHLFEDLSLEKQTYEEKYEDLWNTFEEYKIDYESQNIELEEAKMELEDYRERAENAEAAVAVGNVSKGEEGSNVEEVTQALSIQNSRLREAILRLREQTSIEKMELTKQIHAFEKDAQMISSMKEEIAKCTENEQKMKQEVKDLKEMVDQGSAFEQMVEDLSERVLAVEDNNISLQTTIRELEEASELNAEMEEAQAEEIKILMSELQNRETVVLNLEEAIKM